MDEKTAIVLDTNFIIEHISDLYEVHEKLSVKYDVYVTEISINERISQKYLDTKVKYEKIEAFKEEYSSYANITLKMNFDKRIEADKQFTIEGYNKEFGNYIIPFHSNNEMLKAIMERVYKKLAPFSNAAGASDKGFKDTLMWMSIIQYFKKYKHDISVVFITNDNGFCKNAEMLEKEFNIETGKIIEIKDNNFYKVLLGDEKTHVTKNDDTIKELNSIEKQNIRDKIQTTILGISVIETCDSWGNEQYEWTFTTNQKFDLDYIRTVFYSMKDDLDKHILQNHIYASEILALDDRISDKLPIPMQAFELVSDLFDDIQNKYAELLEPFFNAACELLNRNYVNTQMIDDDDDLPF